MDTRKIVVFHGGICIGLNGEIPVGGQMKQIEALKSIATAFFVYTISNLLSLINHKSQWPMIFCNEGTFLIYSVINTT